MDEYRAGVEKLATLIGADGADEVREKFRLLDPSFEREIVSVVFGRTWTREDLDTKTRSLCSICILAAVGRTNALRLNFGIAFKNGISVSDIAGALLQVGVYAGYPATFDALMILAEVINEGQADDG